MIPYERIGAGRVAEVFADGPHVIKLYAEGYGPHVAEAEARNLERLWSMPLNVPRCKGVVEIDGRWGLRMTRMPGRTLADIALAETDGLRMVLQQARLHLEVLAYPGDGFPPLKPRLEARIIESARLDAATRARLLADLAAMPDGDRLCHGDFHPYNILQDGEQLSIIDWPDAACGAPEADMARTYIMLRAHMPHLAEALLEAISTASMSMAMLRAWLPIVAAARLADGIDEETELLLALCNRL